MKITLKFGDGEGGVLVTADAEEARNDQTIHGTRWETDGDLGYAILVDERGLVEELRNEGYEVEIED